MLSCVWVKCKNFRPTLFDLGCTWEGDTSSCQVKPCWTGLKTRWVTNRDIPVAQWSTTAPPTIMIILCELCSDRWSPRDPIFHPSSRSSPYGNVLQILASMQLSLFKQHNSASRLQGWLASQIIIIRLFGHLNQQNLHEQEKVINAKQHFLQHYTCKSHKTKIAANKKVVWLFGHMYVR